MNSETCYNQAEFEQAKQRLKGKNYFDPNTFINALHADDPIAIWIAINGGGALLAAAPDLLAACRESLELITNEWHNPPEHGDAGQAIISLRKAIAKAEGK